MSEFAEYYENEDGWLVKVMVDDSSDSPRTWDNGTHFYVWPDTYYWYNRVESPDTDELWCGDRMGRRVPTMWEVLDDFVDYDEYWDERNALECAQHLKERPHEWMWELEDNGTDIYHIPNLVRWINEHGAWAKPVSVNAHNVSYCTDDPEDMSGRYEGIIFMDKQGQKEMGTPDERVMGLLDGDVKVYEQWAQGDVYGYVAYDRGGNEVDSCWGFFGSDPEDNGMEDHIGKLTDSEYDSVGEWVYANCKHMA